MEQNCSRPVLAETNEEEVHDIICMMRSDCAVGCDGVTNRLLKDYKGGLVPHLTYIFNMCLREGVLPKDLKKSQIRPIYRSIDRDRIKNLRPISILPSISKILEKYQY